MIFEKLTLCDFGIFEGTQSFDLRSRSENIVARPIVLFGGLNGSGKTSVLTAIRIALHGRQSLGFGTSQKKYELLLSRLFHRRLTSQTVAKETWVKLDFSYSIHGSITKYSVERRWELTPKGISERLVLSENDEVAESTDSEQVQAFLTQLVPVGVADLFFFDGEKIADLASEDDGGILTESIKKLFGLDVVAKLHSDLGTYERRQAKSIDESNVSVLNSFNEEIERAKSDVISKYERVRHEIDPAISSIRIDLDRLEGRMLERGGAWALSRDAFKLKRDEVLKKKEWLEARLREQIAGILPVAMAPKLTSKLITQLEHESKIDQRLVLGRALEGKRTVLQTRLKSAGVTANIDDILKVIIGLFEDKQVEQVQPIHRLGENDRKYLTDSLSHSLPVAIKIASDLRIELGKLDRELDTLSARVTAAPSEEQLLADFELIKSANQKLGELISQKRSILAEIKSLIWRQIELVRRIKKYESEKVNLATGNQINKRISAIKISLDIFSEKLAAKKIALLAENFMHSFKMLSRKNSLIASVTVDPNTLALKLIGVNGEEVLKSQLSAGERQLFAIAMLDALAKTSGRSIPIIIDTPLGRLDSQHRNNFVKNYLPFASHQIIVLSTDTEVDENFYKGLEKHISHAYHLDFNEHRRATTVKEGYFWQSQINRKKNAA